MEFTILVLSKKNPHLNSLLTGRLERATGALEAERHSLGFHCSATAGAEKDMN